jgi:ABC-type transporter Mla subunit MlaD
MARGKKTPEETKAKVIELKLLNLELSSYDIAKELEGTEYEVSADTIQDIIKELPQVTAQSKKWEKILATMDEIIDWIASITSQSVKTIQGKLNDWTLSVSDLKGLNDIAKNNFDRKQILTGKPTDIFKHEWLSIEQADKIAKLYNNGNT